MDIALVLLGIAAQVVARRSIAQARRSTWAALGPLFAILIPLTLLAGTVTLAGGLPKIGIGVLAGIVLYLATQVFLVLVRPWTAFVEDSRTLYRERSALPLPLGVALGALIAAGEELFWRGLVIATLTPSLGVAAAAVTSLVLFVAVNAVSRSRPVIVGSLVGGAAWTLLAVVPSGGVLVAVSCHVGWTTLMILVPRQEGTDPIAVTDRA